MKREQLEHLIRAAGDVSGSRRLIVIGSQAILAQHPYDAPPRATLSREADLIPLDAPEMSERITGALGELSHFDQRFGYYADGVSLETAVLPAGWQERLIPIENANTNGIVGLCLEVNDLLISKYVAGREKDREFCTAVAEAGLANASLLRDRLDDMPLEAPTMARIMNWIATDFSGEHV